MTDLATLATQAIHQAQATAQQPRQEQAQVQASPVIRKLFMLLHGSYGNAFVSKFSTGEKDSQGRDKGIRVAMKVWESGLATYPADVVEAATNRVVEEFPEHPPNLPQFKKLCEAIMPRKTYAEEQGLPALPAPKPARVHVQVEHKNDGKDWARKILARIQNGDRSVCRYSRESAEVALGLRKQMS